MCVTQCLATSPVLISLGGLLGLTSVSCGPAGLAPTSGSPHATSPSHTKSSTSPSASPPCPTLGCHDGDLSVGQRSGLTWQHQSAGGTREHPRRRSYAALSRSHPSRPSSPKCLPHRSCKTKSKVPSPAHLPAGNIVKATSASSSSVVRSCPCAVRYGTEKHPWLVTATQWLQQRALLSSKCRAQYFQI